jgi:hypothetical protein
MTGSPAEVASELDRLDVDHPDKLDRGAVWAIRQFLTDPAADDAALWSSARTQAWSSPAVGYWLSGTTNQPGHHTHPPANWTGAPTPVPPIPLPDPSPQPTSARAA